MRWWRVGATRVGRGAMDTMIPARPSRDRTLGGVPPSEEPRSTTADPSEAADAENDPRLDRYLTIPNAVTLVRLLCLPLFVWLLFGADDPFGAAVLLGALGATDWIDGYVARHFDQVSDFGKLFDPTVDRLLFFVGVISIVIAGAAPLWFCLAVLVREAVVATITVVLFVLKVKPVDVTWFGKAGTFALMVAFPMFLGGSSDNMFASAFTATAWVVGIPGLLLSYYAGFAYIPLWRARIADARTAPAAAA